MPHLMAIERDGFGRLHPGLINTPDPTCPDPRRDAAVQTTL